MARFTITFGATALVALLIFCNPTCDAAEPNYYSRDLFNGLSAFTNIAKQAAYSTFPALPGPQGAGYWEPLAGMCPIPARLKKINDFIAKNPGQNSSEVYPMSLVLTGVIPDICGWMRSLLSVSEDDYECSPSAPQNISALCNMLHAHDIAEETLDVLQSVLYDGLAPNVTEEKQWIESSWDNTPYSSRVLPVVQLYSSYSTCHIPPFNASETSGSIEC